MTEQLCTVYGQENDYQISILFSRDIEQKDMCSQFELLVEGGRERGLHRLGRFRVFQASLRVRQHGDTDIGVTRVILQQSRKVLSAAH